MFPNAVLVSSVSSVPLGLPSPQLWGGKLPVFYFSKTPLIIQNCLVLMRKNKTAIGLQSESGLVVSNSLQPHGLYSPWNSPGQNTGVGSLSLLQGIFTTAHCSWILHQLSHQRSPRIWSGQPIPSPADLPDSGIKLGSPALQADSLLASYQRSQCSLPRFSVHGIFHARVLEWVAISFSRGSSQPRDQTQVSSTVGRRFTV